MEDDMPVCGNRKRMESFTPRESRLGRAALGGVCTAMRCLPPSSIYRKEGRLLSRPRPFVAKFIGTIEAQHPEKMHDWQGD